MFDSKPVIANVTDLLIIAKKIDKIKQIDDKITTNSKVPVSCVNLKKKLMNIKQIDSEDESKTIKWL